MTSVKGVVKANELLVPLLILFLVIIGVLNLKDLHLLEIGNYIIRTNQSSFLLSAILYSSYNSILLIPVLLTLKDYIQDKKQILKITSISTAILIILSIIIFLLLVRVDVDIEKLEMPAVYVVSNMFKGLRYVYRFYYIRIYFYNSHFTGNQFFAKHDQKQKKLYTSCANYVYNFCTNLQSWFF